MMPNYRQRAAFGSLDEYMVDARGARPLDSKLSCPSGDPNLTFQVEASTGELHLLTFRIHLGGSAVHLLRFRVRLQTELEGFPGAQPQAETVGVRGRSPRPRR